MPRLQTRYFVIAVGLLVLALWSRLHGHLGDELWWDEVLTRTRYATGDAFAAFRDYSEPNNHILFSVWLSLWIWLDAHLRGVMLVQCLLTLPLLMGTASRLAGRRVAVVAGLLFVCSSITPTFALQLRGYGASWIPLLLALYALLRRSEGGGWGWLLLYAGSVTVAIGIVPTNALACAVLVAWYLLRPRPWGERALVLLAPALGLLVYVPVWGDLLDHMRGFKAHQTRGQLLAAWLLGLGQDFWPLLGAMAGGLWLIARRINRPLGRVRGIARQRLAFVGAAFGAPVMALQLLQNTPFPRTLVPALPFFCIAIAIPLGALCVAAARRSRALGLTIAILIGLCGLRAATRPRVPSTEPRPQTLTEAYYHRAFRPSQVAREQIRLEAAGPPPLLFTGRSDPLALSWAQRNLALARGKPPRAHPPLLVVGGSEFQKLSLPDDLRGRRVVVVSHDDASALKVSESLRLKLETPPELVSDTGFFKLYELHARF